MQKEGREYCGIHGPVVSENKNQTEERHRTSIIFCDFWKLPNFSVYT
jgi:hypothetical protein